MRKRFGWLLPLALLTACGPGSKTYTFKGEVIVTNHSNRLASDLPERIKVTYELNGENGKATGSQLVDVKSIDNESVKGNFEFTITTDKAPVNYIAIVTRPNGQNICTTLPCPSPKQGAGENRKENVPLKDRTTVTDTLHFTCTCQ
jgi:hypothetical protein